MKFPRVAALVLVFPMIAALAGVIVSLKSVMVITYCMTFTTPVDYQLCEEVEGGITQYSRHTPAINLVFYSQPAQTGINSFRSMCPGTDACDKNMKVGPTTPNTDYSVCLPSSVKRIFDAGVICISVSLGVQALSAVLLFLRKGTRLIHQALCAVVVVGLITSVSTFLSGPTRLQSLCFDISSEVSVKAVVSPGGWLLVASMLGQIFCLVANHFLLAASVQPAGTSGVSYGWLK